jgi:hypothetical protein
MKEAFAVLALSLGALAGFGRSLASDNPSAER